MREIGQLHLTIYSRKMAIPVKQNGKRNEQYSGSIQYDFLEKN